MPRDYTCKIPSCKKKVPFTETSLVPFNNPEILAIWANAMKIAITDVKPSFRLCHQHFDPDTDFIKDQNGKKVRISPIATPTKFLVSSIQPTLG